MKLIKLDCRNRKLDNKEIFITMIIVTYVIMIISMIITRGVSLQCILHRNSNNAFMDFFNSLIDVGGHNPYGHKVIYPPLAELIFSVCRKIIPMNWLMGNNAIALRNSQMGLIIYLLILLVCFLALFFIIRRFNKINYASRTNEVFALSILLSFPMLYTIERGNIIIISLIFLCLFALLYDSDSRVGKEIGLISLAISAGIKIYPAIYGVVLIKERRWKEAARCIVYGILAFVLPSVFYGGIGGIIKMLKNLGKTTLTMSKTGYGYKVSLYAFVSLINEVTGINISYKVCAAIFAVIVILALILVKTKWKTFLILSLPCIMIPQFSYVYTLIFLIVPLAIFVNDKNEESNARNYVYIGLFVILLTYIPITKALFTNSIKMPVSYLMFPQTLVEMIGLVVLTIFTFTEILTSYLRNRKGACK